MERLGVAEPMTVVIMGAGRLGQSIFSFPSFPQQGIRVVGVFDKDPTKIGRRLNTSYNQITVESPERVAFRVAEFSVSRAIIAVPCVEAQGAADTLIIAGVSCILNYAPVNLCVPAHVRCERVDPAFQLAQFGERPSLYRGVLVNFMEPSLNMSMQAAIPLCFDYIIRDTMQKYLSTWQAKKADVSFFNFLQLCKDASEGSSNWDESTSQNVAVLDGKSIQEDNLTIVDNNVEMCIRNRPASAPIERSEDECSIEYSDEWLLDKRPSMNFNDLFGLASCETFLRESFESSKLLSSFTFSSILLYGPPGCGKTSLAKSVASEYFDHAEFFMVSAVDLGPSSLRSINKHKTNSKKTIIFLDNIDMLCKSHRLKMELLKLFENISSSTLVMASTSLPWELDLSILRYFERRISVPLPDLEARGRIFSKLFENNGEMPSEEKNQLASLTSGYSFPDIALTVKDYLMVRSHVKTPIGLRFSLSRIKPTISEEVASLYKVFSSKFGHSDVDTTQLSNPSKHYLSLYC